MTGLVGFLYFPRTAIAGNAAFFQSVLGIGNDGSCATTAAQHASEFLPPMNIVGIGKQYRAVNAKTQSVSGVQGFLVWIQSQTEAMQEGIAWSKQSHHTAVWNASIVNADYGRVEGKRETSWIYDLEFYFQGIVWVNPEYVPVLQVNPLPLSIFLQLDAALRRLCGSRSSFSLTINSVDSPPIQQVHRR